ncbi:hypothetical protein [Paenibacillus turpanensis]|uniref:hypothetical protein n=1 Tax=Paenibacillus turpanensis TaxID=2689078 RepID=UPI00140E5AF6|nr:hypothetical protein [Paenibacillus turpanensis]
MSRKWERLVEKNQKAVNKQRIKSGKQAIQPKSGDEEMEKFIGRQWLIPLLLVGASVVFAFIFNGAYTADYLYWVTIAMYAALGLFHYFVRRPFIKIGKNRLSLVKYGRERFFDAADIKSISVAPGTAVIEVKEKNAKFKLSKTMQRLPIDQIAARLASFARRHSIAFHDPSGMAADK